MGWTYRYVYLSNPRFFAVETLVKKGRARRSHGRVWITDIGRAWLRTGSREDSA